MLQIEQFCQKWQVVEFSLFGSVLRDDFDPMRSDIDVMVRFHPSARPTFWGLDDMEAELKLLFERDVDVIMRSGVEQSINYLRRREILSSAKVIYESEGSSVSA